MSEILHFDGLLLKISYKNSATKVQKSYLSWHWKVMQSLKKNWIVVSLSNFTWGIWWIFNQTLKGLKISRRWAIFVQSIWGLGKNKYRGITFHGIEQGFKILINPDIAVSKMAWGIGWTFITVLKILKNCTLMGSFCPKRIMFQRENFKGIMCHDAEGWCKIYRKTICDLENDIRNFVNFHASSRKTENLHFG